MTQYKVLDPKVALYHFVDEENARLMISSFATRYFGSIVEAFHTSVMMMDFNEIRKNSEYVRGAFCRVTSFQMRKLVCNEMIQVVREKDEKKLIEFHALFLQTCFVLCQELEDYLKEKIPAPDIGEYIKEFTEKHFKEETETQADTQTQCKEIDPESENNNKKNHHKDDSCPGCNIF